MVAHPGKIARAAESAAGLHAPVCGVPFGQMRRGEHVLDRPQPLQHRAAVYLLPFPLEFDGAGGVVAAGDAFRVRNLVVEIPHRHDAGDALGLERIHQAAEARHGRFPARLRARAHLGRMVVDQHGEPPLPFAEYGEEDVPRVHHGSGAVVEGAGLGRFEAESALAVEQRTVDAAVVGGIVMHYGIIEFVELRVGNEGLQHRAVAHLRKGHDVRQPAVDVPRQQDGLRHRIALRSEAASAPALPLRPSRRKEILHIPEQHCKAPIPARWGRFYHSRQGTVCFAHRDKVCHSSRCKRTYNQQPPSHAPI